MRTRRPSRFQRSAAPRAAALPASSPSARTITSRTSVRQIESSRPEVESAAQAGRPRRLHGGEAGLDALPDHQHVAGWRKPHSATAAGPEHHLLRIDRRLARRRRGQERCGGSPSGMSSTPRVTSATIAGQIPPERMFQTGMKAERRRRRKMSGRASEISLDQRASDGRVASQMQARPACACHVMIRLACGDRRTLSAWTGTNLLRPQSARPQSSDYMTLTAASVAVHQDLSSFVSPNRKARLAVVMSGAAGYPAATCLATTQGPGDAS